MKSLPWTNTDYRNEFLAQCDQAQLAKAKAGDKAAMDELNKDFTAYKEAKAQELDLENRLLGAANLAEFRANPKACIAELEKETGPLYVYEIAASRGLFKIISERWSRKAGAQFGEGTDWGGKVATKGWKATIEIGDQRYEIEGDSYYHPRQRNEAVCAEAWKTLLRTVHIVA